MIQLATDPSASRTSYRPEHGESVDQQSTSEARRGRIGHAWPFLSRYAPRPVRPDGQQSKPSDSGS
jgi:hypothetical protein